MAKREKHTTDAAGNPDGGERADSANTVMVAIPAGLTLSYGDFVIHAETASPKTLAYCLQNGFHQSMVDAAAFSKDDKINEDGTPKSDEEIEAMALAKRQARFDNIVAGTVGSRVGGPRLKGVDKLEREVATEQLTAWAASKGKKLPTGKGAAEKIAAQVDKWLSNESRKAACRAEAERRHAAQAAAGADDFDLDDAA